MAPCAKGTNGDRRCQSPGFGSAQHAALGVDEIAQGGDHPASGMAIEDVDLLAQALGMRNVVGIHPRYKRRGSGACHPLGADAGPKFRCSSISRMRASRDAHWRSRWVDPSVEASSRMTNSKSANVWPQNALHRRIEIRQRIVDRHDHADRGGSSITICDSALLLQLMLR